MRTLVFPLLLALLGFVFLVYWTYPRPIPETTSTAGAESPAAAATEAPTGEASPLVEGRLVDSAGRPLPGADLDLEGVLVHEADALPLYFTLDDDGRFRGRGEALTGDLELRLWSRDARGAVERFANLELELSPGAPADVGDVGFHPLPTLVAGRAVDAGGAPLAGVSLQILEARHEGASSTLVFAPAPSAHPLDGRTDEAGDFVLRGVPKGHGLALQVQAEELDLDPSPRLFAPRSEELVLVLAANGSLTAPATLAISGVPVDLGFARPWVRAWPAGAPRTPELRQLVPAAEVGPDGAAHFDSLPPGFVDLTLHLADPDTPAVCVREGVFVSSGPAATRVEALAPERLERFDIRVLDPAGAPLRARFEYRRPGETTWIAATPTSADPDRPGVLSAWGPLDLRVSAAGHEPSVLRDVDGPREVTLAAREE